MKNRRKFIVPVGGCVSSFLQYEFDIDNTFFDDFCETEILSCSVKVNLGIQKQENSVLLLFALKGFITLTCDCCLDPYDLIINTEEFVELRYNKNLHKQNVEEDTISPEQQEIDVKQYIFDFICLQIPFRKVHPEGIDGQSLCNPEFLKRLDELKAKPDSDPRWNALKNIDIE